MTYITEVIVKYIQENLVVPEIYIFISYNKCATGFLVNDQHDAQILFYVFLFITLHVSSTPCSSSGETLYQHSLW